MTHFIRRLCSALFLVTCFSSASNAQEISTSGELITNTQQAWDGCSTATSGSFWGGYSGGPCPGNSGDHIIFSYGQYTLSQTTSLGTALANAGTGLQIDGYNYGWRVKNSNINGTQPGSYDPIAYINVTLYNRDGTVAEQDIYNYGYHLPEWTSFSGTRTYSSPYSLSQVDNITLSVTSRDSGYWAGYYGPEFMNFSLTVNYSVDPCAVNILSSPSCDGYLEYISSLSSAPTVETISPQTVTSIESAAPEIVASTTTVPQIATNTEQINSSPGTTTVSIATQSSSVESDKGTNKKSGPSLSQIQSIVGAELNRINQLENKTVSESTTQAQAASDTSAAQAESVAGSAQNQSIAGSIEQGQISAAASANQSQTSSQASQSPTSTSSLQNQQRSQMPTQQQIEVFSVGSQTSETGQVQSTQSADAITDQQIQTEILQQPTVGFHEDAGSNNAPGIGETILNPIYSLLPPPQASFQLEIQNDDVGPSILSHTPRAEDAAESPADIEQPVAAAGPSVRRGGIVDGMAGGDINSLTSLPAGFDSYLSQQMADAQFYASRDIYRGQRNVDNARALRGLGTDRLHQQMVDQQYNIGEK